MLPSHFHNNKKGHSPVKDSKWISHSLQPRPALIQPDPECDRVIWFPSQLRRLIEKRKSRWRFSSSLFIYVRSSFILCGQATELQSIDGSIVEWPHSAALGRLECAAHGQASMVFRGVWAVYFNRPLYRVGCLLGFLVFLQLSASENSAALKRRAAQWRLWSVWSMSVTFWRSPEKQRFCSQWKRALINNADSSLVYQEARAERGIFLGYNTSVTATALST